MLCTQNIVSTEVMLRFVSGDTQLRRLQWSDVDSNEVRFRGHKEDQAQVGSVVACTRSEVRGPCFELGESGGAVMLFLCSHYCDAMHCYLNTRLFLVQFREARKSMGIWSGVESAERGSQKVGA